MSFIVFSLPRSRSAWLSVFLSYGGRRVGHDIGTDGGTPEEFLARIQDGTCETGAMFAWERIRDARPDLRFAVVFRPVQEVLASLGRVGLVGLDEEMYRRQEHLEQIADQKGTYWTQFSALSYFDTPAFLFHHCLGEPMNRDWYQKLNALNIQVDMPKRIAKLRANHTAIEALKDAVRRRA